MFTFGFGDVIDRFEKHFGPKVTKALMGLVAVALAVGLVGWAIKEFVYPMALWFGGIAVGNPALPSIREGIGTVLTAVFLAMVLAFAVTYLRVKPEIDSLRDLADEATEWLKDIEERRVEAKATLAETQALYARIEAAAMGAGLDVVRMKEEVRLEREASLTPKSD